MSGSVSLSSSYNKQRCVPSYIWLREGYISYWSLAWYLRVPKTARREAIKCNRYIPVTTSNDLIRNFWVRVAARKLFWADPSLGNALQVVGALSDKETSKQTNKSTKKPPKNNNNNPWHTADNHDSIVAGYPMTVSQRELSACYCVCLAPGKSCWTFKPE